MDHSFQSSSSAARTSSPKAYVASSSSDTINASWYLDSRATNHLTNNLNNLSLYQPYEGEDHVTIADGNQLPMHHTGTGLLPTPSTTLKLHNILHVPSISSNLISVQKLAANNNCTITFDDHSFVIQDKVTKHLLFQGHHTNGLYHFSVPSSSSSHCFHSPTLSLSPD